MRLWLLTTEYPPQSGGGISTYCSHTAKMFASNGIDVTVFVPARQAARFKISSQQDRIRVVYFQHNNRPQAKFLGWESSLSYEFSEVLKSFQGEEGAPDFIEAQEYLGIAYYPLQRRLLDDSYLKGSVFYVTAHAPSFLYLDYNQAPTYELPQYWTGEMERSVLKTADFVISPSRYLIDSLQARMDLGTPPVHILRNPFQLQEQSNDFVEGELVFFGKLTPQKGCLEMLEYLKEMWDGGFTKSVRLIGDGRHFFYPKLMDMGKYLEKTYRNYIERGLLFLEGHISPGEIESRLRNAHVVIIPSIVDNLPYTTLEAMAMGKLVLASKEGGQAEIIDNGVNGFLFSHREPGNFSNSLRKILELSHAQVLTVGQCARDTILRGCSYDSVFAKKIEILKTAQSRQPRPDFPFTRRRERVIGIEPRELVRGLLTVIIPFYNLGRYIEECVTSIIGSDYSNIEIVIIDDGSSEAESVKALARVEKQYSIRTIRQRNVGISATRNRGAEIATGEYLAFLDADDTVHPSYYSRAIRILEKYQNVSFVGCWAQFFGENKNVWPSFNPEPPYLLTHNMLNSSGLIFKTDHFISAGGNDQDLIYGMEDYESVLNLVKKGFGGVVIPEILWNYRIRSTSMAQSFNRYSELYLYRIISRKHSDFYREYAEEVTNILNANGPGFLYKNPTMASSRLLRIFSGNSKVINFMRRNGFLRKLAKIIVTLIAK